MTRRPSISPLRSWAASLSHQTRMKASGVSARGRRSQPLWSSAGKPVFGEEGAHVRGAIAVEEAQGADVADTAQGRGGSGVISSFPRPRITQESAPRIT